MLRFTDVTGGVRLAFRDEGRGEQALVLLHAFPLHSAMWEPQLKALSSSCRVLAPDLKGFGGSDAPLERSEYSMDSYADELASFLDNLDLRRVVLAGLSMGGYVALAFLRRHRERVGALVLADTRAGSDAPEVAARRVAQQVEVAAGGVSAIAEMLLTTLVGEYTHSHRRQLIEQVRSLMGDASPGGVIGALEAMRLRADATEELSRIEVPTLVVVGDQDVLSPPAIAEAMSSAIAASRFALMRKSGHLSNLEAADQFNAALGAFLEDPLVSSSCEG